MGGWKECEGAIPVLFLAYPRDDVDVCFVTAERKRPLVCRQRKDTRQSLTPLLLCQVPTRLRTSVGLGLTRYAKRPVPPPRPRDDNIRRRVDPNTPWSLTPPQICLCLCSLPLRYFQLIGRGKKKKKKKAESHNNAQRRHHKHTVNLNILY